MARKKRRRRIFLVLTLFIFIPGLTLVFLFITAAKPPLATISMSQSALSKARLVEAEKYAKPQLVEAESVYDGAVREWKVQNERWFFVRDYSLAQKLFTEAYLKASHAEQRSMVIKDSLQHDLSVALKSIEIKVNNFDHNYSYLPLQKSIRNSFTTGKLLYLECKEAYERGEYKDIRAKLDKANFLISQSVKKSHGMIEGYFSSLGKWKRWAEETVRWSRENNSTAFVVDKFARKCMVYRGGKLTRTFEVELGPNWIGDKTYRGDKATPEGRYHVTRKKSHRETKYYKALLINYPNDEDRAQYAENVRKGRVPRRGIGGLIEFHGDGGKGINWTDGCVALTNDDMDKLYDMASVGTPITIVGSLRPLREVNGF